MKLNGFFKRIGEPPISLNIGGVKVTCTDVQKRKNCTKGERPKELKVLGVSLPLRP
jgi:hypothetical protein